MRVDHAEEFKIRDEPGPNIIDTTPEQLKAEDSSRPTIRTVSSANNSSEITAVAKEENDKEARRERAVHERYEAMSRKREKEERKRQRRKEDRGEPSKRGEQTE